MFCAGRHHLDFLARFKFSVYDAHIGDHSAVGIVHRVKNHGAGRRIRLANGRGYTFDNTVQQSFYTLTGFTRNPQNLLRFAANQVRQLFSIFIGHSGGQVDLIQDWNNRKIVLHCQVEVGESLGFNPLCRINKKQSAFACGK